MIAHQRIATTYILSLAVEVFNRLVPFFILHIVTAKLGSETFGQAQMGMQLVDVAIYFVIAGYSTIAAIDIGKAMGRIGTISEISTEVMVLRFLHALMAVSVLIIIVESIAGYTAYRSYVYTLSFLLFSTSLDLSFINTGTQRLNSLVLANFFVRALSLIGIYLWVTSPSDGILYAVLSFGCNALVSALMLFANRKFLQLKLPSLANLKARFSASLPFSATLFLRTIHERYDLFIVEALGGAVVAGLYAVPYRLSFSLLLLVQVIINVFFAEVVGESKQANSRKLIHFALCANSIIFFPLIAGAFVVGKDLLTLLAGADFAVYADILVVLLALAIPTAILTVCGQLILQVNKNHRFYNSVLLVSIVLGCLLAIPLGRQWGPLGIAASVLFTRVFMAFALLWRTRNELGEAKLAPHFFIATASLIMGVGVYQLDFLSFWLRVPIGGIIYAGVIIALAQCGFLPKKLLLLAQNVKPM